MLGAALLTTAGGCGGRAPTQRASWTEVPPAALGGAADTEPVEAAVRAGDHSHPWLIGGVVLSAGSPAAQQFRPVDVRSVAVWVAPSAAGPWTPATLDADPQRDGPNETMMFFAGTGPSSVAFGWRNSPTEGYPRPSAWVAQSASDATWSEVLEPREFFGGPNIVGYGGVAAGPHGFFIAGTWTDARGHPVVSVWASRDGTTWSQDATSPTFEGVPGETPFGRGVADGGHGALLIATAEVPTRADPGAERGAAWYAPDGRTWTRQFAAQLARTAPRSTFDAVAATPGGWVVAGTQTVRARTVPAAWFVGADLRLSSAEMLPLPASGERLAVTGIAATGSRVVVSGALGATPVLWTAPLTGPGRPGSWEPLSAPPPGPADLHGVVVSASAEGTIVALEARTATEVWTTAWH